MVTDGETDDGRPGVTVGPGFAGAERDLVANLYWSAFGGKLGRVMGPDRKARRYISKAARADHALVARDVTGEILGVAGFKTCEGAFFTVEDGPMSAVYGRVGAVWRMLALALLESDVDNRRFLADGIFVAPQARGKGVGTALVEALAAEARRRGHAELKLDVVSENTRARALYERLGFRAIGGGQSWFAGAFFGLRSWVTMVRVV